jgi:8-oxo-dGTP pyrophosphatase MutT (NUDIX family)
LKSDRASDFQYAALPYRIGTSGMEVLLITSRETGRWVIPKGWSMEGRKPRQVAEIEARQEAGVKGVIGKKPIGTYPYAKSLPDGSERLCLVTVFPLRVTLETVKWRERKQRERTSFAKDIAESMVDEGGLGLIIEEWM